MGDRATGIVLIGLRCSGKSTVGRRLAAIVGLPFVDLDDAVAERVGCSVGDIILQQGESAFRALESDLLLQVAAGGPAVLACGGGTPVRAENHAGIAGFGRVLYLRAGVPALQARLLGDTQATLRPSLLDCPPEEEVKRLWSARDPLFSALADEVIDAELEVNAVVDRCVAAWRRD